MSTELEIRKDERPILMKSGLVHWVKPETAAKIQEVLGAQQGHTFVKITELGITINTAQVEGVYTMEQYADVVKLKQGMFQCEYRTWHTKKDTCECAKEATRRSREAARQAEIAAENRPMTENEKRQQSERFRKMNEVYALERPASVMGAMFVKGNRSGRKIRRSTITEWEEKHGPADLSRFAVEEDVDEQTRAEALAILE